MRERSSSSFAATGAATKRNARWQQQRRPRSTLAKSGAAAVTTCLKKILVASAPCCWYWYWFAATTAFSGGCHRFRAAEGWIPRPTTTLVAKRIVVVAEEDAATTAAAHLPFVRGTTRRFSSTAGADDGTGKDPPPITGTDGDSEDGGGIGAFATDYHAPVMVDECLDALLDCERGRVRNPNRESDRGKKKKKKKGGKKKKKKRKKSDDDDDDDDAPIAKEEEIAAATGGSADAIDRRPPHPPPRLVFVDGTLGGGGHSSALLRRLGPGDVLFGCDVDPEALRTATERLEEYTNHPGTDKPLFVPVRSNFGDLAENLPGILHPVHGEPILGKGESDDGDDDDEIAGVDGILLDLGVSSHQIDEPGRGFSFMRDGPLDMRMGRSDDENEENDDGIEDGSAMTTTRTVAGGLTAADICNEFDEAEIQRILSVYGDEPKARTVARAIAKHRPLRTTGDLVEAIASVTPRFAKSKRHGTTATCARVFQSLRIVVNDEDGVLSRVLSEACPGLLRPGGRLVVMSYHSMEDRATKRIMRDGTLDYGRRRGAAASRAEETDLYGNYVGPPKPFRPVRKRRKATDEEIASNPRARSAVLRVAERLDPEGHPVAT